MQLQIFKHPEHVEIDVVMCDALEMSKFMWSCVLILRIYV